jgi:hypothetical protein
VAERGVPWRRVLGELAFRRDPTIRVTLESAIGAAGVVLRHLGPIEGRNRELLAAVRRAAR